MAKWKNTKGQTTIYKKNSYKTKERVKWTPLKTGSELMWSGRVCSSCSINPLITLIVLIYKPGDRSWTRKGPVSFCDKWNISVVICDKDII